MSPRFPPMLTGIAVPDEPMSAAIKAAGRSADPGRLFWRGTPAHLGAGLELAPDMVLEDGIGVLFAAALGFADAVGVLAPPEVGVFLRWPNVLRVNGADCGRITAAAPAVAPEEEPAWLVVGLDVRLAATDLVEPGVRPGQTTLADEGAPLAAEDLVEAWARHTLSWIYEFTQEGMKPLHAAMLPKLEGVGTDIAVPEPGHFVGLDERGGMILRQGEKTKILPLWQMLEGRWHT